MLLEFHFHIGESPSLFQLCRNVFHTNGHMKILGLFRKKTILPSFAITIGTMNLKLLSLRIGVGGKLHRTFLLFVWHRLGNLIGIKCNRGGWCTRWKRGLCQPLEVPCLCLPGWGDNTGCGGDCCDDVGDADYDKSYQLLGHALHKCLHGVFCYTFQTTLKYKLLRALLLLLSL